MSKFADWRPGQVRELENYLQRYLWDSTGPEVKEIILGTAYNGTQEVWKVRLDYETLQDELRTIAVEVTCQRFDHTDKLQDVKIDGEYPITQEEAEAKWAELRSKNS